MRYILCALAIVFLMTPALAAERPRQKWGNQPGDMYGFGTSPCKSADCFQKHRDGSWVHPLTVPCGVGRGHRCPR
jgi:hypothetical protein